MTSIEMVSRVIFSFFFCWVLNFLVLNLDVRLVQTWVGVVMVSPMNVVERLAKTLKVANLYYFAFFG